MNDKVKLPIEQDGYNAYAQVDGKRVPVLSTSMGNCWHQDDQRYFCSHIVKCVNNHERLVNILKNLVGQAEFGDVASWDESWDKARELLARLEQDQ